jgi:hypothetical protein
MESSFSTWALLFLLAATCYVAVVLILDAIRALLLGLLLR